MAVEAIIPKYYRLVDCVTEKPPSKSETDFFALSLTMIPKGGSQISVMTNGDDYQYDQEKFPIVQVQVHPDGDIAFAILALNVAAMASGVQLVETQYSPMAA